jgi:hypothetical protein
LRIAADRSGKKVDAGDFAQVTDLTPPTHLMPKFMSSGSRSCGNSTARAEGPLVVDLQTPSAQAGLRSGEPGLRRRQLFGVG